MNSPKLNDLLTYEQIKKLRKYSLTIVVNDEEFDNYGEAIDFILDMIEDGVEIMRTNSKYRKKIVVPEKYKETKRFEFVEDSEETTLESTD